MDEYQRLIREARRAILAAVAANSDHLWKQIGDYVAEPFSDEEWALAVQVCPVGSCVRVEVIACLPMGYWVALGDRLVGQVEVVNILDENRPLTPMDWPKAGQMVVARVLQHDSERNRVKLTARPADVFEPVHVELNWYDGPMKGVADLNGVPHYFSCVFDAETDGWDHKTFDVWPVAPGSFELEVESWQIFVAWNDLYEAERATVATHPDNAGVNKRCDELAQSLGPGRAVPASARRLTPTWHLLDENKRRFGEDGPSYRVAWTPARAVDRRSLRQGERS